MIYKDHNTGLLHSISRGGKNYDKSIQHILTDKRLLKVFELFPKAILDGELYIHGKPLQYISGLARTEPEDPSTTEELEYWIFDMIFMDNLQETFKERLVNMENILKTGQNIPYETDISDSKIKLLTQIKVITLEKAKAYHDKFVEEFYEGAVIKNADAPYKIGGRTSDMLKIKEYQDAEAVVIDKIPGLREYEDMVFLMQMPDGTMFKAKPVGTVEDRKEYWDNFEEKYKGKTGTYKYFSLSKEGVPTQPIFKCFRNGE